MLLLLSSGRAPASPLIKTPPTTRNEITCYTCAHACWTSSSAGTVQQDASCTVRACRPAAASLGTDAASSIAVRVRHAHPAGPGKASVTAGPLASTKRCTSCRCMHPGGPQLGMSVICRMYDVWLSSHHNRHDESLNVFARSHKSDDDVTHGLAAPATTSAAFLSTLSMQVTNVSCAQT